MTSVHGGVVVRVFKPRTASNGSRGLETTTEPEGRKGRQRKILRHNDGPAMIAQRHQQTGTSGPASLVDGREFF